jgi:hypothetical protein
MQKFKAGSKLKKLTRPQEQTCVICLVSESSAQAMPLCLTITQATSASIDILENNMQKAK